MKSKTKHFLKLTIATELRKQMVTAIKVGRGPASDNIDFKPVVRKTHRIKPIRLCICDKGYDDEKNHKLLREELHAMSIIPVRYEEVPVWRTKGRYRKEGDEEGLFEEEVSPEVEGRNCILNHQENYG